MKKFFLFSIIAFSINVYAQNNHKYLQPQHSQHSNSSNPDKMKGAEGKASELLTGKKPGNYDKYGLNELFTLIQLYDSIYFWTWDTLHHQWALNSKIIDINYDAQNNWINRTDQIWTGSAWENDYQYVYTYEANNQTGYLSKNWDGSAWVNSSSNTYAYDSNDNPTSETQQSWNGTTWVNHSAYSYNYDVKDNLLNELAQDWNGSTWEDDWQLIYVYDDSSNQISKTEQFWHGSSWDNSYQLLLTYDAYNNWINLAFKNWNGTDWEDNIQGIATYDTNHNLASETLQIWDDIAWVNFSISIYTYDNNNNLLTRLDQYWDGSAWENGDQHIYTYAGNNQTTETHQRWFEGSWKNLLIRLNTYDQDDFLEGKSTRYFDINGATSTGSDSTHYYFHSVVATHDLLPETESINVYPNPNEGKFTIESKTEITSLDIYKVTGERVYSDDNLSQQKQEEIDLNAFGPGIYFLNISDGKKMVNLKVVIQ